MKKYLIIGMIGAVALVAVARKTNVWSYAGTMFAQVERDVNDQIPTKFELQRIHHEIDALDSDISRMVRPIAEYKVAIDRLRKDITRKQANIVEQKKTLLAVVDDLKANPDKLSYGGKVFPAERVRRQLERDAAALKRLEKCVSTQQQVLEAKERSLVATQEQLAKVISKKREYQVRLAQLEAQEETLQIAKLGTEQKFDSSRATQIEESLTKIEQRQTVEREVLEMRNGELTNIPLNDRTPQGPVDLNAIGNYLRGNADIATKTASNK
jgi:chromosome segregation ATPase